MFIIYFNIIKKWIKNHWNNPLFKNLIYSDNLNNYSENNNNKEDKNIILE